MDSYVNRNLDPIDRNVSVIPVAVYVATHKKTGRSRMGVVPLEPERWEETTKVEVEAAIHRIMVMQAKCMKSPFGDLLRHELAVHRGTPTGKWVGWRDEVFNAFHIDHIGLFETEMDGYLTLKPREDELKSTYDLFDYQRAYPPGSIPWRLQYVFGFRKTKANTPDDPYDTPPAEPLEPPSVPCGDEPGEVLEYSKATLQQVGQYRSVEEASELTGRSMSSIRRQCTVKSHFKYSHGKTFFRWAP